MRLVRSGTLGLHARLILWLLLMLAVLWLLIWGNTRSIIDDIAARSVDRRLQSTASLLLRLYVDDDGLRAGTGGAVIGPAMDAADGSPRYLLETTGGARVVRSSGFPAAMRGAAPGFTNHTVGQQHWRLYTLSDAGHGVTVRVALARSSGQAYSDELSRDFARPLHWLLPLLAVLAFFSVWRGLAPLRGIERAVARIDPLDPQPLDVERRRAPWELYKLIGTLNDLIGRVRGVLVRQRAFTAGAGHELRTPLAGCRTQLHVATRSDDEARRQRALQQASVSMDRMTVLLEQLLLFARLDPAAPPLERRRFNLEALLRRVVASLGGESERAGIRLALDGGQGPAMLYGNAVLVETLIANLLHNAIRFSPRDGEVRISLKRCGDVLQLTVRDEGEGLPETQRQRIFEPFYKGDGHARRGSGLGLAIVDAVARAHGGSVVAVAPATGAGTEIRVRLPQARSRSSSRW